MIAASSFPTSPLRPPLSTRLLRAGLCASAMGVFGAVMLSGHVVCPYAALTHYPCPGCGSTRAVRALLSFDFASMLRFNALAPIIAACVAIVAIEALWRLVRFGSARDLAERGAGMWAVRVLVTAVLLELPLWGLRFLGLFGGPVPV